MLLGHLVDRDKDIRMRGGDLNPGPLPCQSADRPHKLHNAQANRGKIVGNRTLMK
jgi:hypothetical protein